MALTAPTALDEEEEVRNRNRYARSVKAGSTDSVATALAGTGAVPLAVGPVTDRKFDYLKGVVKPTQEMFQTSKKVQTGGGRGVPETYRTTYTPNVKAFEQATKYYNELVEATKTGTAPSLEALDARRFESKGSFAENLARYKSSEYYRQVFDAYYAAHGIKGVNHALSKSVTSTPAPGTSRGGYDGPTTTRRFNELSETAVDTGGGYRIDPAPQRKKSGLHGALDKVAPYVAGALFGVITGGIAAGVVAAGAGAGAGTAAGGTTGGSVAAGGATAAAGQGVTYSQYAASLGYGSGATAGASSGSLAGYYAANTTAVSNAGTQVGMGGTVGETASTASTLGKVYKGVEAASQVYGYMENRKAEKMLAGQLAEDRAKMTALMQEEASSKKSAPVPSAQALEEARRREAAKMRGKKRGRNESMLSDPSRTALG